MKKIILSMLIMLSYVNAGKIFLGYEFNMDKSKIEGIKKIENTRTLPKPLEIYIDEHNQKFVFLDNKLKMVNITSNKPNLQNAIKNTINNEFRLKKIKAKTKYGKQEVKNIGELLKLVEKTRTEAYIFDSFIETELKFENLSGTIVILSYTNYMKRESLDCRNCEEVEGKKNVDFEILEIYFTEDSK